MPLNVREYSNKEKLLFPASIGDYLSEDHLAWTIDDVVESLDLSCLYKKISSVGNPSYHPKMMLKILFYGYATSHFSSRMIAKGVETDIAFIFLSGMQKPDFRTISDFRKNNTRELPELFVQIVRLCNKLGLIGLHHLSIDSTVIKASANKNKTYDRERLRLEEQAIRDKMQEFFDSARKTDDEEDRIFGPGVRGDEIPEGIRPRQKRLEKLRQAQKELKQQSLKEINLTDSTATFQREKGNVFKPGYRAEVVADEKEQIIVACDVTNNLNDKQELLPSLKRIVENFPEIPGQNSRLIVTADSGYSAMESLKTLEQEQPYVDAYIPDSWYQARQDGTPNREDSPFHKKYFRYESAKDIYVCPNQKELTFRYRQISESKAAYSLYQCRHCRKCPSFGTCTTDSRGRRILIFDNQEQLYTMRRKLDTAEGRKIYGKRKVIIEPVFGNIKHNLRFREFLLRNLQKVKAEFTLIAIAHNIHKITKFLNKLSFFKLPRSELVPAEVT